LDEMFMRSLCSFLSRPANSLNAEENNNNDSQYE